MAERIKPGDRRRIKMNPGPAGQARLLRAGVTGLEGREVRYVERDPTGLWFQVLGIDGASYLWLKPDICSDLLEEITDG